MSSCTKGDCVLHMALIYFTKIATISYTIVCRQIFALAGRSTVPSPTLLDRVSVSLNAIDLQIIIYYINTALLCSATDVALKFNSFKSLWSRARVRLNGNNYARALGTCWNASARRRRRRRRIIIMLHIIIHDLGKSADRRVVHAYIV
jgi:hypothetical protein